MLLLFDTFADLESIKWGSEAYTGSEAELDSKEWSSLWRLTLMYFIV